MPYWWQSTNRTSCPVHGFLPIQPQCEETEELRLFRDAGRRSVSRGVEAPQSLPGKPSVLIIGAQKSASTFLATFLRDALPLYYPGAVCGQARSRSHLAWQSEGHLFSKVLVVVPDWRMQHYHRPIINAQSKDSFREESLEYVGRFHHCHTNSTPTRPVLYDKTPEYLLASDIASARAACWLGSTFRPTVRIVAILRDPIGRARSQYSDRCLNKQLWDSHAEFSHSEIEHKEEFKDYMNSLQKSCQPGVGYTGPGTETLAADAPVASRFDAFVADALDSLARVCPEMLTLSPAPTADCSTEFHCFRVYTRCIENSARTTRTSPRVPGAILMYGFYVAQLIGWLQYFRRDHLFMASFEHLVLGGEGSDNLLRRVSEFIVGQPLPRLQPPIQRPTNTMSSASKVHNLGPMNCTTAERLNAFFAPSQAGLQELLARGGASAEEQLAPWDGTWEEGHRHASECIGHLSYTPSQAPQPPSPLLPSLQTPKPPPSGMLISTMTLMAAMTASASVSFVVLRARQARSSLNDEEAPEKELIGPTCMASSMHEPLDRIPSHIPATDHIAILPLD